MAGPSDFCTVGGLDTAQAGCVYDFRAGRDAVLVGFGGLASGDLVGFGEGSTTVDAGEALKAPFEFFNIASDLAIGKVFVRDLDRIFYQRGVRGVGTSVDEVVDGLGDLLAGSGRVVFVGQSAGGSAALLYGMLLNVDRIVAFSPLTFFTPLLRRIHHDARWSPEMAEIARMTRFPGRRRHLDLRRVMRRRPSRSQIDIYFGAESRLDVIHAQRLAGSPRVILHPVATGSHAIARRMREAGSLKPVLQEALGHS